jgi:hypothetical protein
MKVLNEVDGKRVKRGNEEFEPTPTNLAQPEQPKDEELTGYFEH